MTAAAFQRQLIRSLHAYNRAGWYIDPINEAKAAYVRGDIEVDELERRLEMVLRWSGKRDPRDPGQFEPH